MASSPRRTNDSRQQPPFELNGNKYDLNTYIGRTRNFFEMFNPLLLFTTDAQLKKCKTLLGNYQNGTYETIDSPLNVKLWDAQTRINAIIHPQTQEKILLPFRMSCFVPMNLPIAAGMLLSRGVGAGLFWQWYNQSYNVCVNYCNGNKSNALSNASLIKAYTLAVTASCTVSYGLNKALQASQNRLSTSSYYLLSKTIPFTAVASAGALNVILMRWNEMEAGIDIVDAEGNVIGKSKTAGKYAIMQTALSRVVLPMPILLIPPYVMKALHSLSAVRRRTYLHLPLNLSVMTFFLLGALPAACGLFPQQSSIDVYKLEPQFHSLSTERVWYNRGL